MPEEMRQKRGAGSFGDNFADFERANAPRFALIRLLWHWCSGTTHAYVMAPHFEASFLCIADLWTQGMGAEMGLQSLELWTRPDGVRPLWLGDGDGIESLRELAVTMPTENLDSILDDVRTAFRNLRSLKLLRGEERSSRYNEPSMVVDGGAADAVVSLLERARSLVVTLVGCDIDAGVHGRDDRPGDIPRFNLFLNTGRIVLDRCHVVGSAAQLL